MVKIWKEWLKAAKDDLILLEEIKNNPSLTHLSAFHSQQAIEKSLKALLEYNNQEVPKIHKIQTLVDKTNLDFSKYDELIQLLDALYIEARYPGEFGLLPSGKPSLKEAYEFFNFAKEVFAKVCFLLDIKENEIMQ